MNSFSESQEKIKRHTDINKIEIKEKNIIENTKKIGNYILLKFV